MQAYQLADKAIAQLNKAALRKAERTKSRLISLGFDELTVMRMVDALYSDLHKMAKKKYKELFAARFLEVLRFVRKQTKEEEDSVDELAEMYIAGLLEEPNETTHYAFDTETKRKRDKAKESILSVPTKAQKQLELEKHLRYFLQMAAWYADFTSQGAEESAYKEAGVKKVQRHEMEDDKTCSVCRKADGEIYPINKIPPLPHLRCRRWFTPAEERT